MSPAYIAKGSFFFSPAYVKDRERLLLQAQTCNNAKGKLHRC